MRTTRSTADRKATTGDQKPVPATPVWIACHDTIVCFGASKVQKWCVREGSKNGPLIAVMLTKEVAHALAAAPEIIAALQRAAALFKDALPKFDWGRSALDAKAIALLNEVPGEIQRAIAKANGLGSPVVQMPSNRRKLSKT